MTQVLFTCLFPRDGRGGFLRLAGRVVTSKFALLIPGVDIIFPSVPSGSRK
jgi:hypothetical protein